MRNVLVAILLCVPAATAFSANLVKKESVEAQKKATRVVVLDSGVTVILRRVPDSGITSLAMGFNSGSAHLPPGQKVLNDWTMSVMGRAARGYPKSKLNALTERYSISMGCDGGIEHSTCGMTTLSSFWGKALPAFAAIVKQPLLDAADVKIQKERMEASFKAMSEDPGSWSNDVVNRIYYPQGHPYRLVRDEALGEIAKLSRDDVAGYHKSLMAGPPPVIAVVSDMQDDVVLADITKAFGAWRGKKRVDYRVENPTFDASDRNKYLMIEDRDIPTAYLRLKFPAVSATGKDSVASRLVFEMLNEELWDEVRTRKSLSYGVGAAQVQMQRGIGSISVSTSKPQETLDAIAMVIQRMKRKSFSQAEVDRFKVVFSTSYFLTQETHGGIASALRGTYNYFGSTDPLYDLPGDLERVTTDDIQRISQELFQQMRVGVVYSKEKFNPSWVTDFNEKIKSAK